MGEVKLSKAQTAAMEPDDLTLGGRPIIAGRRATLEVLRRIGLAEGVAYYHRHSAVWSSAFLTERGITVARSLYPDNEFLPPAIDEEGDGTNG